MLELFSLFSGLWLTEILKRGLNDSEGCCICENCFACCTRLQRTIHNKSNPRKMALDEIWFLLPFCHQENQSPVTCNRRWQIMVLTSKTAFNDFFKVWINVFERWSWPELSSALISILRCLLGQIMSVTDKTFFKGLKSLDKCLWAVSKETRPSINYAKDWLVWSRKEFHLWMWS